MNHFFTAEPVASVSQLGSEPPALHTFPSSGEKPSAPVARQPRKENKFNFLKRLWKVKEKNGITLGRIEGKVFNKEEVLTESQLNHHVHIVGASGFGKTVLLTHIIKHRIRTGKGLLFIDLKNDQDTINSLTEYVRKCGREGELKVFSLGGEFDFSSREQAAVPGLNGFTHLLDKPGLGSLCKVSATPCLHSQASSAKRAVAPVACSTNLDVTAAFARGTRKVSKGGQSCTYNILKLATPTQLRDTLMVSLRWSEEYYRNQASSFLLKVLIGLCHLRDIQKEPLDLHVLLKSVCEPEFIKKAVLQISNEYLKEKSLLEECYRFLKDSANFNSLQGLRSQLESLVLCDFGQRVICSNDGIDLFEAIKNNQIVFMVMDSRRYCESSQVLGRFILQDLKATSARIDSEIPKEKRNPFTVIIDEFADLAQEDFIGFLDRARSSKIGIVVAHQEICDLLRISPEFAGRLMGNTSTLYAFLQKRPESAEMISGIAGTRKAWKETLKTEKLLWFDMPSGEKSLREVEEFIIHPNSIKSLRVGECVVIKKYPRAQAYRLKVQRG